MRRRHPRLAWWFALRVALLGVVSGVVLWRGPPLELVPPLEVRGVVLWVELLVGVGVELLLRCCGR